MEWILLGIIGSIVGAAFLYPLTTKTYKQIWSGLTQECGIPKTQAKFRFWDRFKWTGQKTPEGARIIARIKIPDTPKKNLDIGLKNMFAQHQHKWPGWKNKQSIKDYTIVFVEKNFINEVNEPGAPSISRMGYQTAGTTLGLGPYPACKIPCLVIPLQDYCNWQFGDYLMNTAWNEGEHFNERFNNIAEFERFAVANDVHKHYFDASVPVIPAV